MRSRRIYIETEVGVDVQEIIDDLDFDDIYGWIKGLDDKERGSFVEGLPECFDGLSAEEIMGDEMALSGALEVIARLYQVSPYDRDKIIDGLKLAKII